MIDFLLGSLISGLAVVIFTGVAEGTGAQTKGQQALITQCELKLTRDRVCVLQAIPKLEINK